MNGRVFIIAEAGVNHNGINDLAFKLIEAAAKVGADAVKFQTFKTDQLVCRRAEKASYQIKQTGDKESQFEMLKKLELGEGLCRDLARHCEAHKVQFLSTPFEIESLKFLVQELDLPRLKLSSGEITNAPLLLESARVRKPILLSTGMATLGEIESALGVLAFGLLQKKEAPSLQNFQRSYCSKEGQLVLRDFVTLLHCTTEYPASFENVNLNAIDTLQSAFGLEVGYSDHTTGIVASVAAVSMGARVIEKHFTLDCDFDGPDHSSSLEPAEFKNMVDSIRQCEQIMGSSIKIPSAVEMENRMVVRKGLVAARDIAKGEVFSEENITCKRPGDGLSPMNYWDVLGKVASRSFSADEPISL
jgi:N-acetylneuraminate synthase